MNYPIPIKKRYNKIFTLGILIIFFGLISILGIRGFSIEALLSIPIPILFGLGTMLYAKYFLIKIEKEGYAIFSGKVIKYYYPISQMVKNQMGISNKEKINGVIIENENQYYKIPLKDNIPIGSNITAYTSNKVILKDDNGIIQVNSIWGYEVLPFND